MPGTYVLREDLHLATPPPHPSEAPVHNPNPLATTTLQPIVLPTLFKISLECNPSGALTILEKVSTLIHDVLETGIVVIIIEGMRVAFRLSPNLKLIEQLSLNNCECTCMRPSSAKYVLYFFVAAKTYCTFEYLSSFTVSSSVAYWILPFIRVSTYGFLDSEELMEHAYI